MTPRQSLVLELQALAQKDGTPLPELLRRAKVVAVKLKLPEIMAWLDAEMSGYAAGTEVQKYRVVHTTLMWRNQFNAPQPVGVAGNMDLALHFSRKEIRQPLAELSHLGSQDGDLTMAISPNESAYLQKNMEDFELIHLYRSVSRSGVIGILEAVRNRILEWSLELESRGVLGEGVTFTAAETVAAAVTNHFHGPTIQGSHGSIASASHSPGAIVSSASGNAHVQVRIRKSIESTRKSDENVANALTALAEALAKTTTTPLLQKEELESSLAFLAEQCALPPEQRQSTVVLKPVTAAFRSGLGVVADLLQVWSAWGPTICNYLAIPFS